MTIPSDIAGYLTREGIEYEAISHPAAYTSQEQAAASHVSGYEWAKTVVLLTEGGQPIMAALPAPHQIEMDRLADLVDAGPLRLADEEDLAELYPDCEPGAMPPLGPLYGHPVFVDERLSKDDSIVFDAGTHQDAIRMRYSDFERLVRPIVGRFAYLPGAAR